MKKPSELFNKLNNYLILSSDCGITIGKYRSIIIDFGRNKVFYIPNAYAQIITTYNRTRLTELDALISPESKKDFYSFIEFLYSNELIFFCDNLESFPEREKSDAITPKSINNSILEISQDCYNENLVLKALSEINDALCEDIQIRIVSDYNYSFLTDVVSTVNSFDFSYIELLINYSENITPELLHQLLEANSALSRIYIFNSPKNDTDNYALRTKGSMSMPIGSIYYLVNPLNKSCGYITKETMSFDSIELFDTLKIINGCLHKKICIDKTGNIKNCLNFDNNYGNLTNTTIKDVISNPKFKKCGLINKDQIDVCCDCELRYLCTDCRAMTVNENLYGKPLHCYYDLQTGLWQNEK